VADSEQDEDVYDTSRPQPIPIHKTIATGSLTDKSKSSSALSVCCPSTKLISTSDVEKDSDHIFAKKFLI